MVPHRFPGTPEDLEAEARLRRLRSDRIVQACVQGLEPTASVLEIGVGSGVLLAEFARRGYRVGGVDIRPDMIEAARRRLPNAELILAPANALPFRPQSFDLVLFGLVFHELEDRVGALRQARRVAKRRVAVLEWPYESGEFGPPLDHRLPRETVLAEFAGAGLSPVTSERVGALVLYFSEATTS